MCVIDLMALALRARLKQSYGTKCKNQKKNDFFLEMMQPNLKFQH